MSHLDSWGDGSYPRELGLVSCVKTKLDEAAPPQDLYTSDYFLKMRRYAELNHDDWRILSAKHELLSPDGPPIEPYEKTLRDATIAEKRAWAKRVFEQLNEAELLSEYAVVVMHAGKDYYQELQPLLEDAGVTVRIPTEGLGMGNTQSWYKSQLPDPVPQPSASRKEESPPGQ